MNVSPRFLCVTAPQKMPKQEVHIGKLVKSVFDESGMTVSELARRLCCERTNVYSIFRRSSMLR